MQITIRKGFGDPAQRMLHVDVASFKSKMFFRGLLKFRISANVFLYGNFFFAMGLRKYLAFLIVFFCTIVMQIFCSIVILICKFGFLFFAFEWISIRLFQKGQAAAPV